jgi:hypothetical protein
MKFVRRNLISWIALFFALAGSGLAASRYLITSTSQIKPSVLQALRSPDAAAAKLAAQGAHSVVARVRSVGAVNAPVTPQSTVSDPLAGATWTQHAEEVNQIVGQFTESHESRPECKDGAVGAISVEIMLDGQFVGGGAVSTEGDTCTLDWHDSGVSDLLFEPSTNKTHTVSAQVTCGENCAGWTVDSISIDVIGAH